MEFHAAYNYYCDESCHLEHDDSDVMVLGALIIPKDKKQEITENILQIKARYGVKARTEVKWTKASMPKIVPRSEGVIRGNALVRQTPEYPGLAKATRIQGDVVVELTISEEGDVISAHVVSGHPLLRAAALDAARRWTFRPTLLNNKPVKVTGILTFRFSM